MWYNGGVKWFNLKTAIIICIIGFAILIGIIGYSLWDVPKAKELFPFLEISEAFPTKVIALFTALLAGATFSLAISTFWAIRQNHQERTEERRRQALVRIRIWAEETFEKVSQGQGHGFEGVTPTVYIMQERLRVTKVGLLSCLVKSMGIETEAKRLESEITKEVTLATQILLRYIGRLGREKDIAQFREFIGDTDLGAELKPFNNLEEVIIAEQEVMGQLKKVIDSVIKELIPKR